MKTTYFLTSIAIVLVFFMIELFNPFLKAIFVSILLSIGSNAPTKFLEKKFKKRIIATSIMTLILACLFFLPIMYCIVSFVSFVNQTDQQFLIEKLNASKIIIHDLSANIEILNQAVTNITSSIDSKEIVNQSVLIGAQLGKNYLTFMVDIILILVFFFFFNLYSTQTVNFIKEILPVQQDDFTKLFNESSSVMTVVLYATLVTAIFQGFLFGSFVSFFGYDGLLFGVLYGFASLIPVIGGIIMWLPISLYEASSSLSNAIIIAVYSIIAISLIADTFIKPIIINYFNKKVIKTPANVNALLIFFSIVAGLSSFGFWGVIIGPATVSLFISVLNILKKYSDHTKESQD